MAVSRSQHSRLDSDLFSPAGCTGSVANGSPPVNLLRGLAVLILFQGIGEGISHIAGIPVPGPVIGMLLLFLALQFSHTETPAWLGRTGHSLIRWLSLMFLPACTGLFFLPDISRNQWLPIAGAIVLATLLTLLLAALLMQKLMSAEGERP
ncbi:MAG: murein hydrolase regulator LrgA [Porticoccus sp.]|nr:MAG: murein hydrolase regulator LrgA [Porticoccus sp.]